MGGGERRVSFIDSPGSEEEQPGHQWRVVGSAL